MVLSAVPRGRLNDRCKLSQKSLHDPAHRAHIDLLNTFPFEHLAAAHISAVGVSSFALIARPVRRCAQQ
jgi:hypothetical protein